jgi:acyl carrier protein
VSEPITEAAIKQQLRDYLVRSGGLTTTPGDGDRLADHGFATSLRLLDLVGFVEDAFGVRLRPVDLVPDNLASIEQIARTVLGRLTSRR